MGQHECFKVLKKNGGWMTTKQVAEVLKAQPNTVSTNLSKLVRRSDVIRKDFLEGRRWVPHYICKEYYDGDNCVRKQGRRIY